MFHVMGVVLFPSTTSSYPVLIMQDHRKHLKINSFSTWEMSWVIELWCHSSRTVSWFRGRRGMLLDVGKFTKFHFHVSISTGTIIWGHLKPVYRVELVKFTKYEFSFNNSHPTKGKWYSLASFLVVNPLVNFRMIATLGEGYVTGH